MPQINAFTQTFQPFNAMVAGKQAAYADEKQNWLRAKEQRSQAQESRAAEAYRINKQYTSENRDIAENNRLVTTTAKAIESAMRAQLPGMRKSIYESIMKAGGYSDQEIPEFKFEGGKITITYPGGQSISGPMDKVQELLKQTSQDPSWVTHPEKFQHTIAWGAANGLSINLGPGKGAGKGTEDERNATRMGMTPTQYKLWYQEQLIRLRRKYGQLSDMEQRQAIQISTEINALQREITKEEAMMSTPGIAEAMPERSKRLEGLKDQLQAYQDEYDRIVGAPKGAGDFGEGLPEGVTPEILDYYKKTYNMEPEEVIRKYKEKLRIQR